MSRACWDKKSENFHVNVGKPLTCRRSAIETKKRSQIIQGTGPLFLLMVVAGENEVAGLGHE